MKRLIFIVFAALFTVGAAQAQWPGYIQRSAGAGGGLSYAYEGVLSGIPATCTVGELAFITDATAGQNVYGCHSTDNWNVQGDGAGTGTPGGVSGDLQTNNGAGGFGALAPGTGVATALGVNVGSAGAFTTFGGDAGTPSALVGTNITGTAAGLTAGAATALAADPDDCAANNFAHTIAASGALTCSTIPMAGLNATGTPDGTTFLRGDGAWASPAGSGDVVGPASSTDTAIALFDSTTGKLLKNSVVTVDPSGNTNVSGTVVGDDLTFGLNNSDNTNAASHSRLHVQSGGTSAGDARITWRIGAAGQAFAMGIDNSASDALVLSRGIDLGTTNVFSVDTSGYMGVNADPQAGTWLFLGGASGETGTSMIGFRNDQVIDDGVTATYNAFYSDPTTVAAAFTLSQLYHFRAAPSTKGAGSTITTQSGLHVGDLIAATNNRGVDLNLTSGANKHNIYAGGSAPNFFQGTLEIGHLTDTTLSRSSGGILAVEGNIIYHQGGALGTPASATLTNATGLPIGGISATGTPSSSTFLRGDGAWEAPAGSGDVTAAANFATDNSCIRSDGTAKGVQASGTTCTIDDSGNMALDGTITASNLVVVKFNGSKALDTGLIASEACDTMTQAATGVTSASHIIVTPNADIRLVTGYSAVTEGGLQITWCPSTDQVNIKVCNPTAASITPTALTLNLLVL